MFEVVVSGLVTGWAIAVPVGAIAALLVTLTARTSWRVGACAALGVATVDGVYAAVAVLGGAALAARLEPLTGTFRVVAAIVLLALAALTAAHAVRAPAVAPDASTSDVRRMGPARAYIAFVGLTAINPATVVYFAAVVVGNHSLVEGGAEGTVFVLAAFVASALWQLGLVVAGVGLGAAVTGARGRLVTGVLSGVVIAGLALWTLVG